MLAENGSYTETARQLFVTHSAISHSMRALEQEVGCRLLSMLNKKAILTEAGEALLPYARRVLDEMRQAHSTLEDLTKWGLRRLRLAANTEFDSDFLSPVLLKFHKEFPNIRLQVETCGTDEPETWLQNNQADIVLADKPPTHEAVEFIPLIADRFHLVVSSCHPLAAIKSLPRNDLNKHPCFLPRNTSRGRKQLEEFLASREINLTLAGEIVSLDAIKQFIKHTDAMSILPGWSVGAELKSQSFVNLPLGRKPFEKTWGVLHSRSRPLNHAESTLLKLCRKRVAELHT